jgi:hypothetical protein
MQIHCTIALDNCTMKKFNIKKINENNYSIDGQHVYKVGAYWFSKDKSAIGPKKLMALHIFLSEEEKKEKQLNLFEENSKMYENMNNTISTILNEWHLLIHSLETLKSSQYVNYTINKHKDTSPFFKGEVQRYSNLFLISEDSSQMFNHLMQEHNISIHEDHENKTLTLSKEYTDPWK